MLIRQSEMNYVFDGTCLTADFLNLLIECRTKYILIVSILYYREMSPSAGVVKSASQSEIRFDENAC